MNGEEKEEEEGVVEREEGEEEEEVEEEEEGLGEAVERLKPPHQHSMLVFLVDREGRGGGKRKSACMEIG